ncbi:MAG TPA: response regulator transcription factor [Terriglobia bacterium]|jgi:FixJ family two-component response regulator|nr:response regulator transcription factor [Terriglobia bacterium]
MSEADPIVFVVEDERLVRAALERLVRAAGLAVRAFASAQDFLRMERPDAPGCLVLDVRLPGMSGMDLQQELIRTGDELPIVFVTGHGDIPMTVRAVKSGAVEFLTKPFSDQVLLRAIEQGIEKHRAARGRQQEALALRRLYDSLTPREREVFSLVTSGLLNKQIAGQLGTSEKTIKVHRGQVMHKMRAMSFADLVRMAEKLGIRSSLPSPD